MWQHLFKTKVTLISCYEQLSPCSFWGGTALIRINIIFENLLLHNRESAGRYLQKEMIDRTRLICYCKSLYVVTDR